MLHNGRRDYLEKIYNEIFFEDKSGLPFLDYRSVANSYNVIVILLRKVYYVFKKKNRKI